MARLTNNTSIAAQDNTIERIRRLETQVTLLESRLPLTYLNGRLRTDYSAAPTYSYGISNLAANPLNTINTMMTVSFNILTTTPLAVGDYITISGATGVGGITAPQINGLQQISAISTITGGYTITITTAGTATSSTSGGGSSITVATTNVNSTDRLYDWIILPDYAYVLVDKSGTLAWRRITLSTF